MPEQAHSPEPKAISPEPWERMADPLAGWYISSASGYMIGSIRDEHHARRVLACVNFLAGVPTSVLEYGNEHCADQDPIYRMGFVQSRIRRGYEGEVVG